MALQPRSWRNGRALLLVLLLAQAAHAADPQPYTVTVEPTGQTPLDDALKGSATLISLQANAPVGPFALVSRARADKDRLKTALGSFGYYDGSVSIRIDGRDLDDPNLPAALDAATGPVPVIISVKKGPEYKLGTIKLDGITDPLARDTAEKAIDLKPGQPAIAKDVVSAQARMIQALRDNGRALAKVSDPQAFLNPNAKTLDLAFKVDAGPRVDLGPIAIEGLDHVNESFVRRRLLIHQGERFNPAKIEEARQDLAQLGIFSTVRAKAADQVDAEGELPITIDVTERARRAVGVNAAYSTDLGASAGVTWSHRNLFGNAEKLDLGAAITQLGGSATRGTGYNVTAAFTKPDIFVRNQSMTISLQGIKENLEAYDRTAAIAGLKFDRKFSERWTATAGIQAQQSRIKQEGVTRDYTLLGLPFGGRYDSTGPEGLFEPVKGIKAALTITPTASLAGKSGNFVIALATASTYLDVGSWLGEADGRSIIALRGTLGSIQGATTFDLPPDQRFYAGGSATVRGYKYQSVGPLFPSNRPTGGASLAAGTVEFRQRFGESYGAVMFVDAGQVDTSSAPFSGQLRVGAGVGARYYTPIGPIRLDVAVPLNKERGGDSFELYIGIGQAF